MRHISFTHNGVDYINFDFDDPETLSYLNSEVGMTQQEIDAIINAPAPETPDQIAHRVLDERTQGMQAIDDFTLQQQGIVDDRTHGMQDIDDFTLELAYQLQATIDAQAQQIAQLQADVTQLKGGV